MTHFTFLTHLTFLTFMTHLTELIPHIEALIFASDKPLTAAEMTELINQAFGFMDNKVQPEQVDAALEGIVEKYSAVFYPFEVRQSGGGWQFLIKKEYHTTVAQLNGEKFLKRLSSAALETLAIIAYKQPITKGEIETIRGVSSDYSVQKLLEKELIIISGRNEKLPGHPLVYSTSKSFMDYFGINSPEDLPKIKEVLADAIVEPTIINHTGFEQSGTLSVSDEGELIDVEEDTKEGVVNGHSFAEMNSGNHESEEAMDEIANEEFISDESFAGDDKTETSDLSEEDDVEDKDNSSGNENNKGERHS